MGVVHSCGRRTRTSDLLVMSQARYQLLYSAIWASCRIRTNNLLITNELLYRWAKEANLLTHKCQFRNGLSVDPYSSRFQHFRVLYTPDSHQVGKMRADYRLRVSYIVIYSRFQAKCPCGFRRCLLLHSLYLRYSDSTLRVLSGYIFQ